jgi:hypothetical protein
MTSLLDTFRAATGGDYAGLVEAVRPGTQAEAIQAGLESLTGVSPGIYDVGNNWVVMYPEPKAAQVRSWLDSKIFSTAKGQEGVSSVQDAPTTIRGTTVKLGSVLAPWLISRAVPAALGCVLVGYLIGSTGKRSTKSVTSGRL